MYAKVHKNKKKSDSDAAEADKSKEIPVADNTSASSAPVEEKKAKQDVGNSEIGGKPMRHEHNYETLRKSPRKCSDPGYEKIKPAAEPGYASINGPESISSSDPGYEVLRQNASLQDPNYEELRRNSSSASDCGYSRIGKDAMDGYSVVNKSGKAAAANFEEPNYESMPSETASEHNYAALKSNGSESDPNYESVNHGDPNYESVKYLDAALVDPPYERLFDDESTKSDGTASGYERVQAKSDGSGYETVNNEEKTDPPYERLSNDLDGEAKEANSNARSSETAKKENNENPGYETIKSNSDGEVDDDGIVQV